ncbi:MAG: urease accessory protein UreE [Muribaculum sp.]|nr:urease accessory protein UreE [Muribaculum sp.]
MKIFSEVIGNIHTDKDLADKISKAQVEYLDLDQWTAQKSRFIVSSDKGTQCAVALKRNHQLIEGDVLEYDPSTNKAIVARIELSPVFVIDLSAVEKQDKLSIIQTCIELGHAIGNQHWPAVIKGTKVYVPLTVDKKVMQSVMDTHAIPGVTYEFQAGQEVIPYLAPHEIRNLFGGTAQESHSHEHHHHHHL